MFHFNVLVVSWKGKTNTQSPSPAERLPSLDRSSRVLSYKRKRQEKWSTYNLFTPLLKTQLEKKIIVRHVKSLRHWQWQEYIWIWWIWWFYSTMTWLCHLCAFDTTWVYGTSNLQTSKARNWGIITIYIINPWQQATSLECGKQRTSSALALKSYYTCIKCGTLSGNWSQKESKTIY